jgi:hypothetical protein
MEKSMELGHHFPMSETETQSARGLSGNSPSTRFGAPNGNKPGRVNKSPATIVKEAILEATGGDLQAYWAWVVKQSQKEDGAPYVKMILDRVTPPLKPQMMSTPFEFPISGTVVEQAEAVLAAVAQGVLPLDFAAPLLTMIDIVSREKGGAGVGRVNQTIEDFERIHREIIEAQ